MTADCRAPFAEKIMLRQKVGSGSYAAAKERISAWPDPECQIKKDKTKRQDMTDSTLDALNHKLDRLIEAVSRLAPPPVPETDLASADCFVWQSDTDYLEPVR